MEALEVLERLAALGVRAEVAGDRLRLTPGSRAPLDLVEALRQYKAQVIALLQAPPGESQPVPRAIPPVPPPPKNPLAHAKEIARRVRERGLCLLWSEVLEDYIAFVRDEEGAARVPPGYVIYTLRELEDLFSKPLSREMLRAVHNAKKVFEGSRVVPEDKAEES